MDVAWWMKSWKCNWERGARNEQGPIGAARRAKGPRRTRTRQYCVLGAECNAHMYPFCPPCEMEATADSVAEVKGVTCRWGEGCVVYRAALKEVMDGGFPYDREILRHSWPYNENIATQLVENVWSPHTYMQMCPLHLQMDTDGQFGAACPTCAQRLTPPDLPEHLWACSACWLADGGVCCQQDAAGEPCAQEPRDRFKQCYMFKRDLDEVCHARTPGRPPTLA